MLFGPLAIFALVIILFAIWAGGRTNPWRRHNDATDEPRQVLDRRFARGEIDEEEYLRRSAMLDS